MKVKLVSAVFVLWLCAVQPAGSASAADPNSSKDFLSQLKNPTDWLELEMDLRLRAEYYNNKKLDKKAQGHEELVFPRYRLRAGAKIKITDDVDFNIRFLTEPRYFIQPKSKDPQFERNEVLIDKFNLVVRNAFDLPLTITAGRQDIILGSGWLICDGTPLDGGRSAFFDALRFTYDLNGKDSVLDLILISNHADSGKIFNPFHDRDLDLAEQDEKGFIAYWAQKTGKKSGLDIYYIYKQYTEQIAANGYEGEVHTLGLRKYGTLTNHWDYSMEFAPQFGHKNGNCLGSFATNDQLIYNFNDEKNNKLIFGYEYLSGNDDRNNNFDRCFGRVDTWSVLYQGGLDAIDGRSYDSANLHRLYADWETDAAKNARLISGYALLFADDNTSQGGTRGMSKSGNFRGQLLKTMLRYKICKNIEHRLEAELFLPGDFYNKTQNDPAVFLRYGFYWTL